jgi:hypothetical protein
MPTNTTEEELFNRMIIEDGRHYALFCEWQEAKITDAEFEQRESAIMEEVLKKMNTLMCRNCNPLES